jgi:hypothetical protein
MKFYFGGYYLIKPRKADFGSIKNKEFLTCSSCINDTLIDTWAISWARPIEHQIKELREDYEISEERQIEIQNWADKKLEEKRIGWHQVFSDLETINEYSNKFFSHIKEKEILQILFPEDEREDFLTEFAPTKKEYGTLGIYDNLKKIIVERESKEEEFIGYDLIGVELGGDFHTFHCHDLADELTSKFGIELNEFGLIQEIENQKEIIDFMNDKENGHEPVPWYLVKVKKEKKPAGNTVDNDNAD